MNSFLAILLFSWVHLCADKARGWGKKWHGRFLSFGSGVAIAYVFIDLLSKLGVSQTQVSKALDGVFPFFERHVYTLALLGFLTFFVVDRSSRSEKGYALSLASYSLFNFLVGYAVADKDDPEVQPLILFTIAMALHYFTNDYAINADHAASYRNRGRWILISALFLGWLSAQFIVLSPTAVALVGAFVGGGVIMNVTRHELPKENPNDLPTFLLAAVLYAAILLGIGRPH
jgi:hypothetical protein